MRDICDICGRFVDIELVNSEDVYVICPDCNREDKDNIADESTFDEDYWWEG